MSGSGDIFVGIDVSKGSLDVGRLPESKIKTYKNDEHGIAEVLAFLKEIKPSLIVLEATGGLEVPLAGALATAGLSVVVVNPRQVRNFAKATGRLAKTDAIDALVLAEFARSIKPEARPIKDHQLQELSALVSRRHQIVDMLVAEKNRLSSAPRCVRESIKNHIGWLEKRLKETDTDLSKKVKSTPIWRENDKLLQSASGVGKVLSLNIMTDLPELGNLDRKKIAALVGIAPFNCDSGKYKGKRRIWGGRARLRRVLYMATMSAIRFNPVIADYYQRLIKAGKIHKVAMVACMRKFITILNVMMRDRTYWRDLSAKIS